MSFLCLFWKGRADGENKLHHPTPFLWYQSQSSEVSFLKHLKPHHSFLTAVWQIRTVPSLPQTITLSQEIRIPELHSDKCVCTCAKNRLSRCCCERCDVLMRCSIGILRASSVDELPKVVVKCHRKRNTASSQEHPSNPGERVSGRNSPLQN